jgi:hypothetical protein
MLDAQVDLGLFKTLFLHTSLTLLVLGRVSLCVLRVDFAKFAVKGFSRKVR